MMESTRAAEWTLAPNVHEAERIASIVGGGYLVLRGLGHTSFGGLAMLLVGGGLLFRGLTGECPVYRRLGLSTAPERAGSLGGAYGSGKATEAAGASSRPVEEAGEPATPTARVDESSEESFPASDAPTWTPTTSTRPRGNAEG